ncbi:unnamed protein product [Leptidea sinapis]|uniref:Uncharacterized protein n=1 Tax=Leptidea sinapis TaxID=189913 RepID=A0A5E4PPY6_9NEOP|nr:unnamed protein product [Leptidea sinapis]
MDQFWFIVILVYRDQQPWSLGILWKSTVYAMKMLLRLSSPSEDLLDQILALLPNLNCLDTWVTRLTKTTLDLSSLD